MLHFLAIFLLITSSTSEPTKYSNNNTNCDGFQANFEGKAVVGTWHVVAIVPEKEFPDRDVNCYRVEFSETDEAGLRWLVNKTKSPKAKLHEIKGPIVRQRYHTEQAFDVWSKAMAGVVGCFQQVLSLEVGINDMKKAATHNAMMQLHLIKTKDESGPFLVQMLWGRLISGVIYRRHQGITQDQLKPVVEVMSKLRGPQRTPKICENPLRDLLFF